MPTPTNRFTPNFDHLQGDASTSSPSVFARKMLVEFLRQYAEHKGVTHREIAALAGTERSNVSRILAAKYPPTLDTFLKIAAALGLRIELMERD